MQMRVERNDPWVPFVAEELIERDANTLLVEFARARQVAIRAPIPIEDIVEKYLKLRIEFDDLHRLFGVRRGTEAEIFGAIWLETGEIVIDESLDPEENPSIEGRYRFTLAHEGGGHWRLHRPLVLARIIPRHHASARTVGMSGGASCPDAPPSEANQPQTRCASSCGTPVRSDRPAALGCRAGVQKGAEWCMIRASYLATFRRKIEVFGVVVNSVRQSKARRG
jgi:hypothetical protein